MRIIIEKHQYAAADVKEVLEGIADPCFHRLWTILWTEANVKWRWF